MIVVADSSPLIVLIAIEHVEILPALFGQVIVPGEVAIELRDPRRSPHVQRFMAAQPDWLIERAPTTIEPIASLHAGEVAAISLAQELHADLLLIDELAGRQAATAREIPITGTIGVMELAADRELLDLTDAFTRLKETDFWISHELLDDRLRLFTERKNGR